MSVNGQFFSNYNSQGYFWPLHTTAEITMIILKQSRYERRCLVMELLEKSFQMRTKVEVCMYNNCGFCNVDGWGNGLKTSESKNMH